MSWASFSEILGYISIAAWLFAQFPQVVENYKRKSCQGLAWPFLLNWLLGDASNLIGCLLTHQLPFQTWLATYFVFVDCSLVGQYVYYEHNRKPLPRGRRARARTISRERRPSSSAYRNLPITSASQTISVRSDVHGRHTPRTPRRLSSDVATERPHSMAIEESEPYDTALADSHLSSEDRVPQKRVSWSAERHRHHARGRSLSRSAVLPGTSIPSVIHVPSPESFEPLDEAADSTRGRAHSRDMEIVPDTDEFRPGSARKSSKHHPRAVTTTVFLSLCLLYGIRNFPSNFSSSLSVGTVLPRSTDTADAEKIIGRIFAWLCAALYLTSRLPQIWKNFVRKSVDGLSMALFLFAFLGNTFYVASILTSPKVTGSGSTEFLRESIPYLLGSGGTLMFDVTILVQSAVYRKPVRRHTESWTRSRLIEEEERGLLAGQT